MTDDNSTDTQSPLISTTDSQSPIITSSDSISIGSEIGPDLMVGVINDGAFFVNHFRRFPPEPELEHLPEDISVEDINRFISVDDISYLQLGGHVPFLIFEDQGYQRNGLPYHSVLEDSVCTSYRCRDRNCNNGAVMVY